MTSIATGWVNEIVGTTNISSLLYLNSNNSSFLLDANQIVGFENTNDSEPTPIHMILSGTAADSVDCLTTIDKQSITGIDTPLTNGEISFITYSDGSFDGSTYGSEILYFTNNGGVCDGLTLNAEINFSVNSENYTGNISYTFP
ncbi:hypothetical protein E4K63_00280 [Allofrancisella inopinata]|uniref:Uncharacterized protein n=1 Tax=Allofrancisella inopinata TaxID=1085647 RepID=A0AAE6YIF2_9GAMM|nr:hypothetical protein [Allofrancisella inopinata]QIV95352.1 hypothetical protein E4K63_00280 [Allofrancisella inopinata]